MVFDAASGALLSFNREAKCIVAGLRTPGLPVERFAEEVTCRRGDGREATLADLRSAERVRAEEVELSVPDGRSVRTLLDGTPIRSAEGAVETVVVTIQDLAPFEALERSRAEFLGLVSHELRGPLAAIKGSAATALGDSRDPDRAELRQFLRIVDEQADRMDGLIVDLMDAGRIGAGTLPVDAAPEQVGVLVERARTAGGGGRHAVVVDLPPDLPPVMADRRRVVQVLDNLLANAARHSPETSPISAYGRGDTVAKTLEAGAAAYIVKPFSPAELVARIKVALRRRTGSEREPFLLDDLVIDYEKRRVTVAGRPVHLTATEYGLLRALSLDAGGVTTYDSLQRQVWGKHAASGAHHREETPPQARRRGE